MKTVLASLALLSAFVFTSSAQIVITEIHYHPVEEPAFNADGTPVVDLTHDVYEFVEIQNTGADTVNLAGWALSGGIDYAFPSNATIAAGAFRVIAKDPVRLAPVYSLAASNVLGPYTGRLSNDGDTVRVRDAGGNVVDSVTYDSKFPWAGSADALGAQDRFIGLTSSNYQYKGRSLQRVSVTWPSSDPANWLASPLTGPSPGAAQAVTRAVPKPVVIAQSAAQTSDGAVVVRAGNAVTVNCTFSATASLSTVTLEYFVDLVNSTTETRTSVTMSDLGGGKYTASIPAKPDRSIVRYRFKANRGDGLEVVSPRADDPQIAPIGANGVREAWHGYFVTPVRTSTKPSYDVFVSTKALDQLKRNITQNPRRVTAASERGLPRAVPYVKPTDPLWDGTQPGVFAADGRVWDIHIRHHGSLYQRAAANKSFKLHFPEHQPFNQKTSWFETGHGDEFIEAQKLNRLLGLPSSKMRIVDWYFNSDVDIERSEQGEYEDEMLDDYHKLQQQLNPGSTLEETGELYKDKGHIEDVLLEGPYAKGNYAPIPANLGWAELQRYDWTYQLQNNKWKGPKPVRDLIASMWVARGDTPAARNMNTAAARSWFTSNFDMDSTMTSMALIGWMAVWDDVGQNNFLWHRVNGQWVRLGWDYDQVMQSYRTTQNIYYDEDGGDSNFGTEWWKDTFFKAWRTEYNQRLWELNNSFFDPANLTALGLPIAATFATNRNAYINAQLASFGTYYKPDRPVNSYPPDGGVVLTATSFETIDYSHPQFADHAATKWEIRTAAGDYEEPILRVTSANNKVTFPIPFDKLTFGQTYYWRATFIDSNGHPSVVSAETSFSWGTASTAAGMLVINEILASNHKSVQNGTKFPDYIEIRNNTSTNIPLVGYSLTDDPLNATKFVFPASTSIAPGGYLLVWCDNDAGAPGLHSGFELNADGETVLLLNGGNIVDSANFGLQAADISIGRIIDGTGGWQANTPTPLRPNTARILGDVFKLRVNEWMADPPYGEDWFEIFNSDADVVALGGLYLSDTPATPTITQISPLSFIAGKGLVRFWADGTTGGNHANFKLAKGGESIVITAANGATTIDTFTFGSQATDVSQGRLPDGGNTIVSFSSKTASPGNPNWAPAPVYINELLSHSSPPFEDAVEIYNPTATNVDISGWWLSDDLIVPKKFQIPAGTIIPPGGYKVFYAADFAGGAVPFGFDAEGDEALLSAVDGSGALTGFGSLVHFGPAQNNTSFGRVAATGLNATSGGAEFWPLVAHTFGQDDPANVAAFRTGTGAANASPRIGPVTINEIMYHPRDLAGGADDVRDEFIELHNISGSAVDLSGWRLRGDSDFVFATNTTLAEDGYLLLVTFDPTNAASLAAFRATNNLSTATAIYGPYSPKLANSTHNVELAFPGTLNGSPQDYLVDKVQYRDIAPWATTADGGGRSLQRTNSSIIGNNAANWIGATPTPGAVNAGVLVVLNITTASPLPGGVVDSAYSYNLTAANGTPPYSWAITAGSVPGLSLASNGTLSGTPTTAGTNTFTVQVTDNAATPATATKDLTIIIATPLNITTSSPLPDGAVGVAYSQTLAATGGTSPYVWSVSAGALPPGVTLNGAGVVSGTPTLSGTFSFTARVADSGGLSAQATFSVSVLNTPPTITGIADQTIPQDTSTGPLTFTVGDTETAAASLTLSKDSSDLTLVPANNIVFGGSGGNRTVTVTPAAGRMGTATITVGVSDGQYTTSTSFLLQVTPPFVGTRSFTNATAITIPSLGAATPYPSTINVSAMGGVVSNVTMTLYGVTHQRMRDVDILLVGPAGQKVIVLSDVGPGGLQGSVTLTLSDAAASSLGTATLVSGTYKPTDITTGDTFASPAPAGPYASALSAFNAQSPVGTWSLYVVDDSSGSTGSIAGGWSLTLTTMTGTPTITAIADQTIAVDGTTGPLNFTIGDLDTPVTSLTLSAGSSNPALVPTDNVVFGGSGSNRTVTVTPVTGQSGTSTITVTVSDGQYSASTTFLVTVSTLIVGTQTFNNAAAITIPSVGAATPYPSVINVSTLGGTISQVTVKLNGFAHTFPADVDVLMVGPAGQKVMLMSDAGGGVGVTGVNLTLSDGAAGALPQSSLVSGTYKPTDFETGDPFPAPAPTGPYGTALSVFNGLAANGAWSLYAVDDGAGDQGSLGGGWSITITTQSGGGGSSSAPATISSLENPPKITSITVNEGTVQLLVSGEAGLRYALETSSDLIHWTQVSVQDNTTGTVVFTDQPTTNSVQFYRAMSLPQ